MKFANEMQEWKEKLVNKGFNVFAPEGIKDLTGYKEAGSTKEAVNRKISNDFIRHHYKYIKQSEGILVLNYDKNGIGNYIGGNSLMEMGFAFCMNRDIFLLSNSPDLPYKPEIDAMQPIIIDCEIEGITKHYDNLPTVFVSSENALKISSTSLALREFNLRYKVVGLKTKSGISEQPYSIEETYQGAENRLNDLKQQTKDRKPKMLVSIESGNSVLHKKHNTFGLSVCIIEDETGKRAVTIGSDLEIPKEMTDLVPSKYPDLGILVQEKYGVKNKDPYLHFTNGKLSREKLLFNSVVNTLACL
jgi:inosine/xanthosine triphosphatase